MNYESSAAAMVEVPSKGTRLKEILNLVNESASRKNALEAYELIKNSFQSVEGNIHPKDRMEVLPFENMDSLSYKDNQILYSIYNSHVMFIGPNGAVDIRGINKNFPATTKLFDKDPEFPSTHMQPIFSKAGSDGKSVWSAEQENL